MHREQEVLLKKKVFLTAFVILAFIMKIVIEFLHEVGHCLFVLYFGGIVKDVHVSILWPYDFSYISWVPPSSLNYAQIGWIYAGGILVCSYAAFITLTFLFLKQNIPLPLALSLFWFAFWGLINSTGYLILGGLSPFGDVSELITLGVLTKFSSFSIGIVLFAIGFMLSSWILRRLLTKVFSFKKASLGVTLFWFILPFLVVVMLANPERGLHVAYIPLAFIPVLLSYTTEYFLFLSKQKADTNPDNIAKEQSHD